MSNLQTQSCHFLETLNNGHQYNKYTWITTFKLLIVLALKFEWEEFQCWPTYNTLKWAKHIFDVS